MAEEKYVDPDALQELITATQKFSESLSENLAVLNAAARECEQAIGSGAIIKNYLQKAYVGYQALSAANQKAEEIISAMQKDYNHAMEIYKKAGGQG